ncbi:MULTISPECIES: nucleosidase [Acidithiobacillus]|uniref:MTA/SAH nucleosidase n=1 Tax=Acidithiobacillus thiooxidans ATCC 19377 TaxID=637390 RepID=A0A5P9XMU9_ACITH|nr:MULTISPECIES: nucleosidase [Acidithiobacillus]MBU2743236.1 nucleosidase [Acidithiobacillus albertensis]QFX95315.1 MTA/SAH nucleosidase [Acidithiobacillus thiooxidans ATCC 19377]
MQPQRIGIVVALAAEARILLSGKLRYQTVMEIAPQLCMVVSGMGPIRADQAAEQLLQAGVGRLLSWGTAGGLNPACRAGDLLVPEHIFWAGRSWSADAGWRSALLQKFSEKVLAGELCSVSEACASVAAKAQLRADYPEAQAVDMESGVVAQRAAQAGIPFLAIRSVVDPAHQSIPAIAMHSVDGYGRPQILPLLRGLLLHPGDLPPLMGLGRQMQAAVNTLRLVQPHLVQPHLREANSV